MRVRRATARRTVAWLTPRRSAASLELINLCKTCAGLTQHYDDRITARGHPWLSASKIVVRWLKMRPDELYCSRIPRLKLQNGGRERAQPNKNSPPAAKLGAGVEKSPGPSLFWGLRVLLRPVGSPLGDAF